MKKIVLLGDSIRLIGCAVRAREGFGEDLEVYLPADNCRYGKMRLAR